MTTDSAVESLGRVRAKGLSLLLVTFLAGAAAGVAGSRLMMPAAPMMPPFMGGPARSAAHDPMFMELGLTPAQTASIDSVLARSRPKVEAVMAESRPRLRALLDSVRAEIQAVLTTEQRDRFEKNLTRFRRMRPRMGLGGPFPGADSIP